MMRYVRIADEYRVSRYNRDCRHCTRGIEPDEPFIREVWVLDNTILVVIYHALGCPE